jgi:hypothetical protein
MNSRDQRWSGRVGTSMQWIRYGLRGILIVLLLLDMKLFITLVIPPDDHFFRPTLTDWLWTGLACLAFLSLQVLIVWLDVRLGNRKRRQVQSR